MGSTQTVSCDYIHLLLWISLDVCLLASLSEPLALHFIFKRSFLSGSLVNRIPEGNSLIWKDSDYSNSFKSLDWVTPTRTLLYRSLTSPQGCPLEIAFVHPFLFWRLFLRVFACVCACLSKPSLLRPHPLHHSRSFHSPLEIPTYRTPRLSHASELAWLDVQYLSYT